MVTLFWVISIVALLFLIKKYKKLKLSNKDVEGCEVIVIFVLGTNLCLFGFMLYFINTLATAHAIDEKILMYQERNESIEQSVGNAVRAYMDYEEETYSELSNKDAMSMVYLYPELKSDQLVQKQIDIYVSNNDNITRLREQQIDLAQDKWLLYFGR